jgi:hypothetical protein
MPEEDKPSDDEKAGLPPVNPPNTKTPFQVNQQFNIQQIPPRAWERLTSEQIVDVSKAVIDQVERMDQRHFTLALKQAERGEKQEELSTIIGGILAGAGILATTYLAVTGHDTIAAILGTFLASIIAVVVGNRLQS